MKSLLSKPVNKMSLSEIQQNLTLLLQRKGGLEYGVLQQEILNQPEKQQAFYKLLKSQPDYIKNIKVTIEVEIKEKPENAPEKVKSVIEVRFNDPNFTTALNQATTSDAYKKPMLIGAQDNHEGTEKAMNNALDSLHNLVSVRSGNGKHLLESNANFKAGALYWQSNKVDNPGAELKRVDTAIEQLNDHVSALNTAAEAAAATANKKA